MNRISIQVVAIPISSLAFVRPASSAFTGRNRRPPQCQHTPRTRREIAIGLTGGGASSRTYVGTRTGAAAGGRRALPCNAAPSCSSLGDVNEVTSTYRGFLTKHASGSASSSPCSNNSTSPSRLRRGDHVASRLPPDTMMPTPDWWSICTETQDGEAVGGGEGGAWRAYRAWGGTLFVRATPHTDLSSVGQHATQLCLLFWR